jgi:hypothetical protein
LCRSPRRSPPLARRRKESLSWAGEAPRESVCPSPPVAPSDLRPRRASASRTQSSDPVVAVLQRPPPENISFASVHRPLRLQPMLRPMLQRPRPPSNQAESSLTRQAIIAFIQTIRRSDLRGAEPGNRLCLPDNASKVSLTAAGVLVDGRVEFRASPDRLDTGTDAPVSGLEAQT